MATNFEWDPAKAADNLKNHGVSFDEGSQVFGDPLRDTVRDDLHSTADEERWSTIGQSLRGKTLVVIHSDEGDTGRIISVRPATWSEREAYEEGA